MNNRLAQIDADSVNVQGALLLEYVQDRDWRYCSARAGPSH